MTRQAMVLRCREALGSIRARVSFRLVLRLAFALTALGSCLPSKRSSAPASTRRWSGCPPRLYTRPVPGAGWRAAPGHSRWERSMAPRWSSGFRSISPDRAGAPGAGGPCRRGSALLRTRWLDFRRIAGAARQPEGRRRSPRAGAPSPSSSPRISFSPPAAHRFASSARRRSRWRSRIATPRTRSSRPTSTRSISGRRGARDPRRRRGGALLLRQGGSGLSLAESALLAGMIQRPQSVRADPSPGVRAPAPRSGAQLMAEQQRISRRLADARPRGVADPASFAPWPRRDFRDFVLARACPCPASLPRMAVYTTLDAMLQRAAERAVRAGSTSSCLPGVEAALVAIDPRTGEVLAMVGGRDYGASQFNRATDALASREAPSSRSWRWPRWSAGRERSRVHAGVAAATTSRSASRLRAAPGSRAITTGSSTAASRSARRWSSRSMFPFARIGLAVGPERIVATARDSASPARCGRSRAWHWDLRGHPDRAGARLWCARRRRRARGARTIIGTGSSANRSSAMPDPTPPG